MILRLAAANLVKSPNGFETPRQLKYFILAKLVSSVLKLYSDIFAKIHLIYAKPFLEKALKIFDLQATPHTTTIRFNDSSTIAG